MAITATALKSKSTAERIFPTVTAAQITRVPAHGHLRPMQRGDVLYEAGDPVAGFFVVTAGQIEILRTTAGREQLFTLFGPGAVHRRGEHARRAPGAGRWCGHGRVSPVK